MIYNSMFFSNEVEMGYIRNSSTNSYVVYLVTISSTEWKINTWEEPCWRSSEQTQKRKLWIKGERILKCAVTLLATGELY